MNSFTPETNTLLEQQRQQLESLLHQGNGETVYRPVRWQKFWSQFINAVIHWLTTGDEPRISLNTAGDIEVWKVYDPADRQLYYFIHENEVRDWLDQRYYP